MKLLVTGRRRSGKTTVAGLLLQSPLVKSSSSVIVYDLGESVPTDGTRAPDARTVITVAESLYICDGSMENWDLVFMTQPIYDSVLCKLSPDMLDRIPCDSVLMGRKGSSPRWLTPADIRNLGDLDV